MKMIKKIEMTVILFLLGAMPFLANADGFGNSPSAGTISNPFNGGNNIWDLINSLLKNVVIPIATVASVMYIIWAGFKYVTAQGNPAKIQEANKNLLWALIGVGVLLGAEGISVVIQETVKSLIK